MEVAAGDRAQLRMAHDDLRQRFALSCDEVDLVPLPDTAGKRRVVHHEDRWPLALPAQHLVEPAELVRFEGAGILAGNVRVEEDKAKIANVDRVVARFVSLARQVKCLAQTS